MQIFKKDLEIIINLNQNSFSNREIANIIGCHHNTISYNLNKYGLQSSWANQPIDIINDFQARCSKCKKIKDISEFYHGRKGQKYEYKFSYCKKCRSKQCYLNLNSDIEKYLSDRYNRLKIRANKLNIKFNITKEYYISIYYNQKGKCFYTGVKLKCEVGKGYGLDRFSTDKIVPKKGYIKNNIVFCTQKANTVKCNLTLTELKKWIPKWYHKLKKAKLI